MPGPGGNSRRPFDFAKYLRRGERAQIVCCAVTRDQGGIVFGYIKASLLETPVLAPLVESVDDTGKISLTNNDIDITVLSSNFRSLRSAGRDQTTYRP